MKRLRGIPSGVVRPWIGVVTRGPVGRGGEDCVFVGKNYPRGADEFGAVVCEGPLSSASDAAVRPTVTEVRGACALVEGDVVAVEPNGVVRVLFESETEDNVLFLTGECNADCVFCPQPRSAGDFATAAEVRRFIGLLPRTTKSLAISGGEPTLERELLLESLRACRDHIAKARVDLLTNGVLLADYGYAAALADVGNSELVFEIPLYSDVSCEHDRVLGMQGFGSTLRGIFNLARLEQRVGLRTVIHRGNYARLSRFGEFVARNLPFVTHIALMGLEVFYKARANAVELWIDPHEYVGALESTVRVLRRADLAVSIYNHPLCVVPTELWPFARVTISRWKRSYSDCCDYCMVRDECGGTFSTSGRWQSRFIKPVGDRCDKRPSPGRIVAGPTSPVR